MHVSGFKLLKIAAFTFFERKRRKVPGRPSSWTGFEITGAQRSAVPDELVSLASAVTLAHYLENDERRQLSLPWKNMVLAFESGDDESLVNSFHTFQYRSGILRIYMFDANTDCTTTMGHLAGYRGFRRNGATNSQRILGYQVTSNKPPLSTQYTGSSSEFFTYYQGPWNT
jgi:hypothetical protein